ncbi:Permease of the drug/metabolite transporter (DMT) superfamily [Pseudomonas sp. R3-52-08]|nr:Permease of the drug/metabolite transporter (DMT) superfamily [Pseudomonas sp. R3-52-08]
MPDISSPPRPHRSNLTADAVAHQFASRPTLHDVVEQVLHQSILEHYPPLLLDLSKAKVAKPNQRSGWDLKLLTDVALDYLANSTPMDFTAHVDGRRCFLTQQAPRHLTYEANGPKEPDMRVIEQVIVQLADALPLHFQEALAAYWNLNSDTGVSRWQWLGDLLAGNLSSAASLWGEARRAAQHALFDLARYPDRRERQAMPHPDGFIHAYCLETCLIANGTTTRLLTPDILVVQGDLTLLCAASGSVEAYPSMEAFNQAWGKRLESQVLVDKIIIKRYEPDGNLFDVQAALLLNHQLENLEAIQLPTHDGVRPLEKLFADITDPTPFFNEAPVPDPINQAAIKAALPQWLQTANAGDRFAYRQLLVEQARLRRQTAGASFLDGIENLHDFTDRALRELIRLDHPESSVEPGNLELTFHVPVGDLRGGYLSAVTMSLRELAVNNLAAAPHGAMTLRDTSGTPLPPWLTADYILGEKGLFSSSPGLVSRVNIGERYPQKIRELLLSDSSESRRREALFDQALSVHLPLQALEHKIRAEHGFTFLGYRYVKALMQRDAPRRVVDGQDIEIHPLAFTRTPDTTADIVDNMFIIEPRNSDVGPHILYRPLYQDALREFATRQALFDAIAQPGALQDSVLSWLPESARTIYSNGGFLSPHILRFGQGDDTVQWAAPPAAQLARPSNGDAVHGSLAQSLASGNLSQYLYGSNARTLVDLADRDSVSNTESRWKILLEGGWLLFNTLLMPLLRGPAMLAGWMLQLATSLQQDIAALQSDDATARELAWVDVLLNIGLILLHAGSGEHPVIKPSQRSADNDRPLILAALRRAQPDTSPQPTVPVEQGPIALAAEPPAGDKTLVDFIHSTARDSSSRRLLNALRELNVPWPEPAPSAVEIGPYKGLYRLGHQWHASVAGLLFRVSIVPGFAEVFIIHPEKPSHPGFRLKTDGHGHWALDQGLKLRGGGPKNRLKAKLAEIDQKRTEIGEDLNRIIDAVRQETTRVMPIDDALNDTKRQFERAHVELKVAYAKLRSSPEDKSLVAEHAARMTQYSRARLNYKISEEQFHQTTDVLLQLRRDLIKRYREFKAVQNQFDDESKCIDQYLSILAANELRIKRLGSFYHASFYSDEGQPLIELQRTAHDPASSAYVQDLMETVFAAAELHAQAITDLENTLEEMVKLQKSGASQRTKYLNADPVRRFYNRIYVVLASLDKLTDLSIDLTISAQTPQEQYLLSLYDNYQRAMSSIEDSHIDLLTTEGFTSGEHKDVLNNLIKHYNRRLQICRSLVELDSPLVRPHYMTLLIERLEIANSNAETELANLLREEEFLPPRQASLKPIKTVSQTKRTFKSRDKGALVGDLQPTEAGTPFPTIVTRNPITQQISGRFMEHPAEGWVEIVDAKPAAPAPAPQVRAFATLRGEGNRLIGEVGAIEKSIEFQKRKLKDPLRRDDLNPRDWSDMLDYQAKRIEAIADEIHTAHQDKPEVAQTVARLREQAGVIRQQGVQHCIEGYKAQRPRQENIDYLRRHGAVDIGLVHGPQRTAAKDYVSEFAVREKNAQTVLWYAHFHYSSPTSAGSEYTAAHLKRPEHRFLTLKDLIVKAGADSKSIVRDLYNPVTAPLDQQLFLSLLPG